MAPAAVGPPYARTEVPALASGGMDERTRALIAKYSPAPSATSRSVSAVVHQLCVCVCVRRALCVASQVFSSLSLCVYGIASLQSVFDTDPSVTPATTKPAHRPYCLIHCGLMP